MSIEQYLKKQFRDEQTSLQCPPSLDAKIMADFRQQVMVKGRGYHMKKRWSLKKAMLVAAVVVLLCGFGYGGKLLYSYTGERFSLHYNESDRFLLSAEAFEKTRAELQSVHSQLEPGQTAIVYAPQLDRDFPIIGVAHLDYVYDQEQWKQTLEENGVKEKLPASLLNGTYSFAAGAQNNPFHANIGLDQLELMEELEAEAKNADQDEIIWRLTDLSTNPDMQLYTTVYKDSMGEALYLTWQVLGQSVVKMDGFISSKNDFETYHINGKDVHYIKNNQALLGDSGVFQSVSWYAEEEDGTMLYSIETDSLAITKETLIEAVKSLP